MKKTRARKMVAAALAGPAAAPPPPATLLKLDLGCGPNKIAPDWTGVDAIAFPGVDVVFDLANAYAAQGDKTLYKPWPWPDGSVAEVHCSHFLEHLMPLQRVHFANELYRVMAPGATCRLITPDYASIRAYGDLTHQWPPVVTFWFHYLDADWRKGNAPHNAGYTCDFKIPNVTWGFSLRPDVVARNQEYQIYAMNNYKEVCQDLIATLRR